MNDSLFVKKFQGMKWLRSHREVVIAVIERFKSQGLRYGEEMDKRIAANLQSLVPDGVRLTRHIIKDFRYEVGLKAYSKKPKVAPINLSSKLAEKLAEGPKDQTRAYLPSCKAQDILPQPAPGLPEHPHAALARVFFPKFYCMASLFPRGLGMLVDFAAAVAEAAIAEYRREHGQQSGGQPDGQETPAAKTG